MGKDVWNENFASNDAVNARVKDYFVKKMREIRDQRVTLEEEWMRYYRMWSVEKDDTHTYVGRSELYIPEVRKNIESQARQWVESAFPNQNFLDVMPGESGTKTGANIQKDIRKWQIHQAGLRVKYHVYSRQAAMLGTSPIFVPWRNVTERVLMNKLVKGEKRVPAKQTVEIYNGPDFVVRDLFKWYPFNLKKEDILEDGCFEYVPMNEFELRRKTKQGNLVNLESVLAGASDAYRMEELTKDVERQEDMGINFGPNGYAGVAALKEEGQTVDSTYNVFRIFTKINLPEATEADEDPDLPIPVWIEIINNEHVTLVKRNPFFHQRPPYLVGKYLPPNPDEFYGQGIPKAIQFMQYEINSKAEQAMDSATLALNPLAIIDPGLASQANDFNVEPGAIWFANPDGVKFSNLPDVSNVGYQAIGLLRAQMQEFSDRAPALPPQLLGKSRSATQSSIVSQALQVDVKAFQAQNEILVLNPLMEMWESLTDQNIKEDQIIMILSEESKTWRRDIISKNATLGRYRYFWKSSSNLIDKAILGRSIIDLIKVTSLFPPEERLGLNIDYTEIFRMLWSDAFQLPDAAKLFGAKQLETILPEVEHKQIQLGIDLEVLPGDDDARHLDEHNVFLTTLKGKEKQRVMEEHLEEHRTQGKAKIQKMQLQAQRQQLLLQQAAQQQAPQKTSQNTSQGSGNRAQLSPNASIGNVASGLR